MAGFQIAVGDESFEEIRRNNCYYVDKTELLYQLTRNKKNKVTLFTRPRRFGKTLTMDMMVSFFDITKSSRHLFEGLAVTKHEELCAEWMNQYPVLFISFKDVDGLDFESAFKMLKSTLADVCKNLMYLAEGENVNPADVEIFHRLMFKKADIDDVKSSLKTLMRMMYAKYNKPVILLIDEYDVPLAKSSEKNTKDNNFYSQMLDVIKGIMSVALKTNEFLKFAVITGCLRIAKESIFTGTNNFKSYSILDKRFSNTFGFTETEVKQLLRAAYQSNKLDLMKSWYDGYIFGNSEMFCPWDVVNYVSDLDETPDMEPENYWKNTSGNDIIKTFVGRPQFKVSRKFETLMNGGTITQTIADELTYDLIHASEDNLWSVLFMTGYLTKADKNETGSKVRLKIPNKEIASIFQDKVVAFFEETLDHSAQQDLMTALWDGDEETASKKLSDFLWATISYNDYHENFYHAFLAGIFVGLSYEVESDQENGLGRTDIILTDTVNRRAIIIEAKKSDSENDMEKACLEGKQQIIDKQYIKGLNGYTKVMCYGVAFYQKTAFVRVLEMN